MDCPFCKPSDDRIEREDELSVVIRDGLPVSNGHSLIIPRRHVGSLFDINEKERKSLYDLLEAQKDSLDASLKPDGYNIGVNDGSAAGQTVPHLHIHLIPRYHGDRNDPRGGVRWIFPELADYWSRQ